MPTFVRKKITTGSSNIRPNARINVRMKAIYRPIESIGVKKSPTLKVRRNPIAKGRTMKKQKAIPKRKRTVAKEINGNAYLFSFGKSPGEINFQA